MTLRTEELIGNVSVRRTPMGRLIRMLGLKPTTLAREATRIAGQYGRKGITRQYLARLSSGTAEPTAGKIFVLVGAMRAMTGRQIRATDLFELEPPLADGGNAMLPVSSPPRGALAGRLLLPGSPPADSNRSELLERLYREHGGLLRVTAQRRYNVPPDDAEALVHDIFASYLERQPAVEDVRAFLLGAINNACKHYWRIRSREVPLLPEHDETADPAATTKADEWAVRVAVATTLSRLGAKCRETLRAFYFGERSTSAIASRLNTTAGYVQQLLTTCRRRAREIYRELTRSRSQ